jgi:hypothetical protein
MRSRKVWAVLFTALLLAAVFDLVVLTTRLPPGPPVPTVRVHADRSTVVPIADVVRAMQRHCPQSRARVRLEFVVGDDQLEHWFECSDVRADPAATGSRLVALAATRHHAAERADEVNRLQRLLGMPVWGHNGVVWWFGTGHDDYSCTRADDDRFHHEQMQVGTTANAETPLHWTEYEAARIGGACPERLSRFLQSISAIGHPGVAAEVRGELARFGVPAR